MWTFSGLSKVRSGSAATKPPGGTRTLKTYPSKQQGMDFAFHDSPHVPTIAPHLTLNTPSYDVRLAIAIHVKLTLNFLPLKQLISKQDSTIIQC
jgi:hypothetical protein